MDSICAAPSSDQQHKTYSEQISAVSVSVCRLVSQVPHRFLSTKIFKGLRHSHFASEAHACEGSQAFRGDNIFVKAESKADRVEELHRALV
jgi:hypothetical protein